MRILSALAASLALCTPIANAAAAATSEKGTSYSAARAKPFPIRLTDKTFGAYTSTPRDYATVVLLTAMDAKFGCGACQMFAPEWDLLASSWQKGDRKGESGVVFGTLDFVDGKDTFTRMKMTHAPILYLFPPTEGKNAKDKAEPLEYDFQKASHDADAVRSWIAHHLPAGPHPPLVRPFDYTKAITTALGVLGGITILTAVFRYAQPLLQSRNLWAAVSLLLVLLFTSGYMFTQIRHVPYVSGDGKGGVVYFGGGFQNQLGIETQIIAALYGLLAFAAINLAIKVPRIADPQKQSFAVLAWAGGLWFIYSFTLTVFRWKNSGYPFFLPPF